MGANSFCSLTNCRPEQTAKCIPYQLINYGHVFCINLQGTVIYEGIVDVCSNQFNHKCFSISHVTVKEQYANYHFKMVRCKVLSRNLKRGV